MVLSNQAHDPSPISSTLNTTGSGFFRLLENARDLIVVLNPEGDIRYISPSVTGALGYLLPEVENSCIFDYIHPDDVPAVRAAFDEITKLPDAKREMPECRALHKNGAWLYFEVVVTNLLDDPVINGLVINAYDITRRKEGEETQRRHTEYLNALHETSLDLMNRLELPDLLQEIINRAGSLVGTTHGFIAMLKTGAPNIMRIRVTVGNLEGATYGPIRLGEGLTGKVWQMAQTLVLDDYSLWEHSIPYGPFGAIKAVIGLPLMSDQQVIGVLGLAHFEKGRRFSTEEIELLNQFVQIASLTLDNARLYSSVQRRLSELTTVQQVAKAINSTLRLNEVFQSVVNQISASFRYDLVSIYLREGDKLIQQAQTGYDIPVFSLPLDQGVSGWVARSGHPAFVNDATLHPDFIFMTPGIQQAIIIPLKSGKGQVLGTLAVESRQAARLTEDDVNLLTLLADQVSVAVENAHLFVELSESEEKYRDVINSVKEVIFQTEQTGHWAFLNPAWEELLGYSVAESLNTPAQSYIYSADRTLGQQLFGQLLSGHADESRQELRLVAKNGAIKWVEAFGRTIQEPGAGRPVGVTGILVDITNRKQAEEDRLVLERKMLEAQRLESLGILTGGIAHDFNNLLTAILGNAELAQLRLLNERGPDWLAGTFQEIETAALYASDLTRQMLAYSGKGRLFMQQFSINAIAKEIIQLLKSSLMKQKATLECTFAESLPDMEGDISQVRQVIMNLIVNASEAIGETAGTIRIVTGRMWADQQYLLEAERWLGPGQALPEGYYLFIEVSDTGCGMDDETQARIFDPFFTTKFTGRGLGLSAVQGIVRGHRGALRIDSQPGHGTTFRVLFPNVGGLERVGTTGKLPNLFTTDEEAPRQTVLLIDDDELLRSVTSAMLEQTGYRALAAASGEEGLVIYREHQNEIDCILLDLVMPDLTGEETLHALYEVRPDVHVILMSGYSQQEVLTRNFEPGATLDFLQKPYTLEELRARLEGILTPKAKI